MNILKEISDFFVDIFIIFKLFFVLIYYYGELIWLNITKMFVRKNIDGKKVLITGAAGGIGKALVEKFIDLNCTVICLDKNKQELDKMKKKFKSNHKIKTYNLDLSSIDEIKSCCKRILSEIGFVDILINNAGILNNGKLFLELNEQEILNIFDVNIFSYIWLCKQFLPQMIDQNQGQIVNISSVLGLMGSYKLSDYSSTKFAVVGFTESIRKELKKINKNNKIIVSLVCPFHVKTDMFNGVEFTRLKWASLSMTPDYVANKIVDGIIYEKELILIPAFWSTLFFGIKNLVTTKFCDYAQEVLDVNNSMDKYKKLN